MSGSDALVLGTVRVVEDIESKPTEEEVAAAEVLDAWGHRLITNRGYCSIEMRVDHNGYYGGELGVTEVDVLPPGVKVLDDF